MAKTCKMMISLGFFFHCFLILFFLAARRVKVQKVVKMKNKNYIRQALYLRNSILCDHNFWHTCVKWWYLQALFFIFSKFWFSRVLSGGKMSRNSPYWQKILSVALNNSGTINHIIAICGTQVQNDHVSWLFSFYQNFDFSGC